MSKQRALKAHQNLLMDVIKRQAGTVSKAILEGVMNSIDAEAEKVEITLDSDRLVVQDDGKGLQDLKFFETFGQPHEEGDAVYGTFRMGRGQLFAFGRNIWKTAQFLLDVDVKNKGLDYLCEESDDKNKYPGCHITVEFYDKLSRVTLMSVENELRSFVKYSQIPVWFNGEKISKNPAKIKWQHDTPDFRAKFTTSGSLSIYNLGVLICVKPYYSYGVGGEIISKKQVKVNFARNDVMSDCPVWKKMVPLINEASGRKRETKKRDDDEDRLYYAKQINGGMLDESEVSDLFYCKKAITDVRGRHHTIESVLRHDIVTVAERGNKKGDVVMQHGLAFVFSFDTLDRFEVEDMQEMMAVMKKLHLRYLETRRYGQKQYKYAYPQVVDFGEFAQRHVSDHRTVPESKYTARERVWIKICSHMYGWRREEGKLKPGGGWNSAIRKIHIGESDDAVLAWTDGHSNIWMARSYLKRMDYARLDDLILVGITLMHEYSHDDDSKDTDQHGPEFYENFNTGMEGTRTLPRWIKAVTENLPNWVKIELGRDNKAVLKTLDKLDKYGETSKRLTDHDRNILERLRKVAGPSPLQIDDPPLRKRKRRPRSDKAACSSK